MMLSVLDNAYLRKAQEHPCYAPIHQKILYLLMHEKKHYTKDELLCVANHSLETLENALEELEEINLIKTEGWLVKLIEPNALCEMIEKTEVEKVKTTRKKVLTR